MADTDKKGPNIKLGIGRKPSKVNSTSAEILTTDTRRAFVFERRMAGDSYSDILVAVREEFGEDNLPETYDDRRIWKDINDTLLDMREHMAIDVEGVRQLELERLDRLLIALWDSATGGTLGAVDRVLKVMQRRAELLGLDKNRLTVDMEARGQVAFYLPERGAVIPLPDVVGCQHAAPLPDMMEGQILEEQPPSPSCEIEAYAIEEERQNQSMSEEDEEEENSV